MCGTLSHVVCMHSQLMTSSCNLHTDPIGEGQPLSRFTDEQTTRGASVAVLVAETPTFRTWTAVPAPSSALRP